jgi:hypothetical protein
MKNEWNKAKSVWILQVLELTPKRRKFNTFGEEYDFFIKHMKALQLINYICSNESCNCTFYSNDELYFDTDENMNVELNINVKKVCLFCNCDKYIKKAFKKKPCWLLITNLVKSYKKK